MAVPSRALEPPTGSECITADSAHANPGARESDGTARRGTSYRSTTSASSLASAPILAASPSPRASTFQDSAEKLVTIPPPAHLARHDRSGTPHTTAEVAILGREAAGASATQLSRGRAGSMSVEPNMELQVVSWNVDGWHTIRDQQLRLLDDTGADAALLQEVTPTSLRRLRHAGWHGDSALELVDDNHTKRRGRRPRFACAVLARRDITVVVGASSPQRRRPSEPYWPSYGCETSR
jgi:hypothetical protein